MEVSVTGARTASGLICGGVGQMFKSFTHACVKTYLRNTPRYRCVHAGTHSETHTSCCSWTGPLQLGAPLSHAMCRLRGEAKAGGATEGSDVEDGSLEKRLLVTCLGLQSHPTQRIGCASEPSTENTRHRSKLETPFQ